MIRSVASWILSGMLLVGISSVGMGQTPPAPGPDPAAAAPVPKAADPWRASFTEMNEAYTSISKDYDESVTGYMTGEIQRMLEDVNRHTEEMVDGHRTAEAKWRRDAVATLESFIARYYRYRTDPQYREHIADTLFKLAELYREQAEYRQDMDAKLRDQRQAEYERGIRPAPPMESDVDYSKAIDKYLEVVKEFRDYRYRDMVMYLVGYYLRMSENLRGSSVVLNEMTHDYPDSPYAMAAWMLIGHNEYDDPTVEDEHGRSSFRLAIRAYSMVAAKKENNESYEDALYRLGWALFEEFKYSEAIAAFIQLLDYGEETKGKRKQRLALRKEAIESIASSFYDADWTGDDLPDPDYGPERAFKYIGNRKPYEKEILKFYGDLLYEAQDETHYRHAVVVYLKYLEWYSMDPENPEVHDRIVYAYHELSQNPNVIKNSPAEAARFAELAQVERKRMVELYGKDSRWAEMHRYDAKALTLAASKLSINLKERAQILQVRAQDVKAASGEDAARPYYKAAADAFEDFLDQFPKSPEYVEMLRRYADIQMFGLADFAASAVVFGKIRDLDRPENSYRAEAAILVLESRAKLVEAAAVRNDPKVPIPEKLFDTTVGTTIATVSPGDPKDPTSLRKVVPVEIPQVVLDWVAEARKYLEMGIGQEDREYTGVLAFQIGKVYQRYGHFEKAREEMEAVLKEYGTHPLLSVYCFQDIARMHKIENDLDNLEKVSQRMKEQGKGDPESVNEILSSIKDARLKARFQRAGDLLEKAKEAKAAEDRKAATDLFSKAANELEKIVDENPGFDKADVSLLEAARSFEEVKLYDKAATLYRRLVDEPRFAKSDFREMAVVNLAENYEKFFNFDGAVKTYSSLPREYPKGENVKRALLKSAELLENDQQYLAAAGVIEEFRKKYPKDAASSKLAYLLIELFEKGNDLDRAEAACRDFVRNYGKNEELAAQTMTATIKLGRKAEERGDKRTAQNYFKDVQSLYQSAGLKPGTKAARLAAESTFRLAESRFNEYASIRLEGNSSAQKRLGESKLSKLKDLEKIYTDMAKPPEEGGFNSPEWIVAAFYKVGALWKDLSEAFANAPYPADLPQDEEFKYQYQIQIGDLKAKFEDKARAIWRAGVEEARGAGIQNEWTQKTLVELNKYEEDREKYPLFREIKQFPSDEPVLHFLFVE